MTALAVVRRHGEFARAICKPSPRIGLDARLIGETDDDCVHTQRIGGSEPGMQRRRHAVRPL